MYFSFTFVPLCYTGIGPFGERNICQLVLKNVSDRRVGFKMKCTAAEYYASNPAHGIIEPKTNATISGI